MQEAQLEEELLISDDSLKGATLIFHSLERLKEKLLDRELLALVADPSTTATAVLDCQTNISTITFFQEEDGVVRRKRVEVIKQHGDE